MFDRLRLRRVLILRVLLLGFGLLGTAYAQGEPAADWGRGPARLEFWGKATPSRIRVSMERWLRSHVRAGAKVTILSDSLTAVVKHLPDVNDRKLSEAAWRV